MLYVESDGKKVPVVIKYFNGGITIDSMKTAKLIKPDEVYWCIIMGVRQPDADPSNYVYTASQVHKYLTNYWVTRELYDQIVQKCIEIGIPPKHADDLSIPISNFPMTKEYPVDRQIRNRAIDAKKLNDFLFELESNDLLHLTKLSFEYGEGPFFDLRKNEYISKDVKSLTINNRTVLFNLVRQLRRVLIEDEEFRKALLNPPEMKYVDFDHQAARTTFKHDHVLVIARYLIHQKLCKSKTNALCKAGMLLAIHGYVLSREEFQNSSELEIAYETYEKYVQKIVTERVKPLLSKRKGKSSKK